MLSEQAKHRFIEEHGHLGLHFTDSVAVSQIIAASVVKPASHGLEAANDGIYLPRPDHTYFFTLKTVTENPDTVRIQMEHFHMFACLVDFRQVDAERFNADEDAFWAEHTLLTQVSPLEPTQYGLSDPLLVFDSELFVDGVQAQSFGQWAHLEKLGDSNSDLVADAIAATGTVTCRGVVDCLGVLDSFEQVKQLRSLMPVAA